MFVTPRRRRLIERLLVRSMFVAILLPSVVSAEEVFNDTVRVHGTRIKNNELTVANVVAGDRITITSSSGIVTFNTAVPDCREAGGACIYDVDASGLALAIYNEPSNEILCYNCDKACADPLSGSRHAGLLMRIGNAFTFVGRPATFNHTTTAAGTFKLGVNDCAATPNSGFFDAPVRINRPAFSVNSVAVPESQGTLTFTVTLDLAPPAGVTASVAYAVTSGTATLGTDFTVSPSSGTLSFTQGQTSKTVTVAITNDTAVELNETFAITLSSPTNGKILTNGGVGTGTINDNDPPNITINNVSITEGNSGTTNATFTVSLSAASGRSIGVNYSTSNGTAVAPADYTAIASTALSFPSGTTTRTLNVAVVGDAIVELNETFNVNLSGATNATITDSQGVGTINDNDPPGITINNVPVTEGNTGTTNATFTVTLSAASGRNISVNYATANGTAVAPADYTAVPSTVLSILSGTTTKTFNVAVKGDTAVELNETFAVNLTTPVNATVTDAQGIGTINDDDPPSISVTDVTLTEGNAGTQNATFTVSLSAASGRSITVNYATANGTATAGSDYTAKSGTLTFTSPATTQTVSVVVAGDTAVELNETFAFNLTSPTNATIADSQGTGRINDNDPPGISIDNVSVTEGNSGTTTASFTVSLAAASGMAISVNAATANNTATAGSDYTAVASTALSFPSGTTTRPVNVSVTGDTLDELNETFFVNLSGPSNATLTDSQGQGTITDNDAPPSVQFAASSSSGSEATSTVNLQVNLSAASGLAISVPFSFSGSATGSGTDFTPPASPLSFAAGATSKMITLTIAEDTLDEVDETVIVSLQTPTNATLGSTASSTYTITDNDLPPSVAFALVSSSGSESAGAGAITVNLSAASGRAISVDFDVTGTATGGGDDFTIGAGPLSFSAGQTSKTISFSTVNDATDEPDETVVVTLTDPTNVTLGATEVHTRTILDDDDPPTISFLDASSSGSEVSAAPLVRVGLSSASGKTITIQYASSGGTASGAGVDFTLDPGTLTLNPGETSKSLPLSIIGDSLDEENETVDIALSQPVDATLTSPTGHTFTILDDDDPPLVAFNIGSSSGNESLASVNLGVSLSSPSAKTATVSYAVTGGTATGGGIDFTLAAGMLTFAPGTTSQDIALSVVDDALNEPTETIVVSLSAPANAALGDPSTHTYSILETTSPPVVNLSEATQSVPESVGSVSVVASLTSFSGQTVTVPFTVSGTATLADHNLASGSISIPSGDLTGSVSFQVVDDLSPEQVETVIVTMGTPSNATAGSIRTQTISILDDDIIPQISIGDAQVYASPTNPAELSFVVTFSSPANRPVTVHYGTVNDTATSAVDYVAKSGTLSFPTGETSRSIVVQVLPSATSSEKRLFVDLDSPSFGTLADARGAGSILPLNLVNALAVPGLGLLLVAAATALIMRRRSTSPQ